MRSSAVIIFSILLVALAFYFLGKKNGSNNTNVAVVQNVSLIKEIAELGALSVNGSTNLKSTNMETTNSFLSRFKNYFGENTLNINIPFTAKYGVDMDDKQVVIDTKDSTVYVYLPKSKLLSLQLKLDEVEAISKTGIFRSLSVEEYIESQKQLYKSVSRNLETNEAYKRLAEKHIQFIIQKYYEPLGFKVECVFSDNLPKAPKL